MFCQKFELLVHIKYGNYVCETSVRCTVCQDYLRIRIIFGMYVKHSENPSNREKKKQKTFIVRYHLQKIDDCTLHSAHRHTNKHRNLFLLNCGIFHKMNKYMQSCMHVEEARHPSSYPRNALKCQMHVAITFDS